MQHAAELRGTADGFAEGAAAEQAAAHQVDFLLAHRWMALALGHLCLELLDGVAEQLHEIVGRLRRWGLACRQVVAVQFVEQASTQPVGYANGMC
ncbi:hypothetical protein D3C76_862760 [compost metagenome]